MKLFYFLLTLVDCFMIWCSSDVMFSCFNNGETGMAALNLLGVIFWTLLLVENKNNALKEIEKEEKEKNVKKNLEN